MRIARRRRIRRVGSERRELEEERLARRGRAVDERHAPASQDIGQVVPRPMPEIVERPVLVELIVKFRVPPSSDVPFVPARRNIGGRHRGLLGTLEVAVEILAHHRRAVARALERHVECVELIPVRVERADPTVGAHVREHPGVVRKIAGEDRRARRTAQRIRDEIVVEGHALRLERLHLGHETNQVRRQVVSEHKHDVRPVRHARRARRGDRGQPRGTGPTRRGRPCDRRHGPAEKRKRDERDRDPPPAPEPPRTRHQPLGGPLGTTEPRSGEMHSDTNTR